MTLSAKDIDQIRAVIREEVTAIVVRELDGHAKRVGPIIADYAQSEIDKLRGSVTDALKLVASAADLKTMQSKLSKAAAAGEREIAGWILRLEGEIGPIGPRLTAIEELLTKVYKTQHVDIQQGASIRDAVLGVEKSAVTEVPPAFDSETETAETTDATTTEAE
jgi:hypothetical protein